MRVIELELLTKLCSTDVGKLYKQLIYSVLFVYHKNSRSDHYNQTVCNYVLCFCTISIRVIQHASQMTLEKSNL